MWIESHSPSIKQLNMKNAVSGFKLFASTWLILLLTVIFLMSHNSCIQPDKFPDEPQITGVSINKSTIQNLLEDFVVSVEFQDGDGDIGITNEYPEANAFLVDDRTGYVDSLKIPYVSPQGNIKAISGTLNFTILSECCIAISGISCTPNAIYPPADTVSYTVIIKDRSGNVSNAVEAPPLVILCPF